MRLRNVIACEDVLLQTHVTAGYPEPGALCFHCLRECRFGSRDNLVLITSFCWCQNGFERVSLPIHTPGHWEPSWRLPLCCWRPWKGCLAATRSISSLVKLGMKCRRKTQCSSFVSYLKSAVRKKGVAN